MAAYDILGPVFKNGSATLMARVVGNDGSLLTQSDLSATEYTVYLIDGYDPDDLTEVEGHTAVDVAVADVILNSLVDDDRWDADDTGYNFRYQLDVSSDQAFTQAGREYLVEWQLTPTSGQVILVRFRVRCE